MDEPKPLYPPEEYTGYKPPPYRLGRSFGELFVPKTYEHYTHWKPPSFKVGREGDEFFVPKTPKVKRKRVKGGFKARQYRSAR